jgi:aryl-alcohol dehydrogenase-like predicted oxidoreductase
MPVANAVPERRQLFQLAGSLHRSLKTGKKECMTQVPYTRALGASGLTVSPLGVGTNKWIYGKNDEQVLQVFQSSLDAGVCFFDTAEVYGFGKSEQLLGECLRRSKRQAVVASKYMPLPTRQLGKALDASLSRLGLLTLDVYFIHAPVGKIEALMDQMAEMVQKGKIRAVGVSNFSASQMRRAADRLARYNIPLAANEVQYNLLHRQPEVNGVLDACRELNVALVAYVPLASGRLTASRSRHAPAPSFSFASSQRYKGLQEILQTIAERRGTSVSQVILNWLLRRDEHIIPIPGATGAAHAVNNAETLHWQLNDEEFTSIDQASSL